MLTKTSVRPLGRITRRLRRILRSPRVEVLLGVLLFLIGLTEIIEEVYLLAVPALDAHHGLLLLGAVSGLRGLVDVIEGIEHVAESNDGHIRPNIE